MKFEGTGIGNEVKGQAIILPIEEVRSVDLSSQFQGNILVCQVQPDREFIHKAIFLGIAGLVVPGLHYRDLKSVNPNELTIVMLKRFGDSGFEEKEWTNLQALNNKKICINKTDDQHLNVSLDS